MAKKSSRNTKARIVSAAWKLFYEQGYEETTVEEIIFESETSKGSFYHYFDGKDALLSSLSVARRGFWTERTCSYPEACDALWDAITRGSDQ